MKYFTILVVISIFSCFTSESKYGNRYRVKVIGVDGFRDAFLLTCIHKQDTIRVISFVGDMYLADTVINKVGIKNLDTIVVNREYQFDLVKPRQVRVDYVTRLYTIVSDNDTIWRGYRLENIPFYSKNSRGLYIEH